MFVFRKIDRNETGSTRERVNTRRGNSREPSVVVARIDERTAETSRSFFFPFPLSLLRLCSIFYYSIL